VTNVHQFAQADAETPRGRFTQVDAATVALFARWQLWCAQQGIRHSWGSNQFSAKVVSVVPTIRRGRPRTDGRSTKLLGIGLAKKSMG